MIARPESPGTFRSSSMNGSSPPAEAPTAITGKCEGSCCAAEARVERALRLVCVSAARFGRMGLLGGDESAIVPLPTDRRSSCFSTIVQHSRIVVIGASAGGIEALKELVRNLPANFGAPILVVLHIPPDSPSLLAKILARAGTVRTTTAEDGQRAANGVLYVAPPDRHLIVEADGTLRTPRGPRENRSRPSVNPLFRSAALAY